MIFSTYISIAFVFCYSWVSAALDLSETALMRGFERLPPWLSRAEQQAPIVDLLFKNLLLKANRFLKHTNR